MKYIRTKDNVWLFEDGYAKRPAFNNCIMILPRSYNLENCKQADTIEDLCDCFIIEYTNTEPTMFLNFCHLQRHHDLYGQDYHNVAGRYGCIWVAGKGLKYVAKMNDKGELELL